MAIRFIQKLQVVLEHIENIGKTLENIFREFFKSFIQPLECQGRASVNRLMTMVNFEVLKFERNESWDVLRLGLIGD